MVVVVLSAMRWWYFNRDQRYIRRKQCTYGLGGAIYNYDGALTDDNSTFTGNSATDGGAICNINYGGLTVDNSTFTGNNVTYDGGAIYNEG